MYPDYGYQYGYGRTPYSSSVGYGSIELTETSPPQSFIEPLRLDEVISYLNLPPSTTQGDTIQMFITAARECAEIAQRRDLVPGKQWDLTHDYWPGPMIELRTPLVSVDLVQIRNSDGATTALVQGTDYVVDKNKKPGVIVPAATSKTWQSFTPWPSSAVLVRFTSGMALDAAYWSDAGARVKVGMKQLISQWFNNRIPFGAKVEEFPFAITACLSWGAVPRIR